MSQNEKVEAKDKPTKEREQVEAAKNRLFEAIDAWPNTFYGLQKVILEAHALLIGDDIKASQPSDHPTQKEAQGFEAMDKAPCHVHIAHGIECIASVDGTIQYGSGKTVLEAWENALTAALQRIWNAALSHKEKL